MFYNYQIECLCFIAQDKIVKYTVESHAYGRHAVRAHTGKKHKRNNFLLVQGENNQKQYI